MLPLDHCPKCQSNHIVKAGFAYGKRDSKTFKRLYSQLNTHNITLFCSDYWKTYQAIIPSHKHRQSKKETFTIESYNGRIRHYLARFKRKGKCYTKCHKMIENSLNLLFAKWNGRLSYI
ncbi:IS1 family transposase [Moraxella boevrei]|uniref:IS1 family transposase n=1 Tax=Faucicola boevrei TaxID=346665 RepID=UPI00373665B2